MNVWTVVLKHTEILPYDRAFIAYWRDHICLVQYDRDRDRFMCSVYPANHMGFLELRQRELNDITHWMELPRAPRSPASTSSPRGGNYGKYNLKSRKQNEEMPTLHKSPQNA